MKVKDFLKLFEKLDPEQEVIMSKDSEGNGYSPFAELCFCYYVPENDYSGELYSKEDIEEGGLPDNAHKAVVLWPVN